MAQPDVSPLHSPGYAYDYDPATYAILEDALNQPFHSDEAAYISPTPSTSVPTNQPAPFAQYTSLVGRTITSPSGGRFRLAFRRVLGVGAYGVVYLAEEIEREEGRYALFDPSTPSKRHEREATISTAGRMYAVKVMRCAPRASRQRAFQAREVALHRKADGHPGIVPLHAVYGTGRPPTWSPRKRKAWSSHSRLVRPEDELTWDRDAELSGEPLPVLENGQREELVYMVLSYVGGGDLFTMIAENQRYIGDDSLIKSVFIQLLDAVEWCHERNVRHRDLKPENVLCEEGGRTVLISDFGLATTDPKSRDFGCGSSYYMSPECFGDPLSPATSASYDTCANDVWTLGVVLVNLATGRNPWEAASALDPTFTSFCADPANFLMSILPITPSANSVLVRVFERDQAKRCKISELREMVLRVKRWTLRGSELDGADEGARDVARGCGLLDAEMPGIAERDAVVGRVGSSGSGMGERSRFSEDTTIDYGEEDSEGEEDVEWSMYAPGMGRGRSESTISTSSEMSRSRPVSKILSNSPTLQGPIWGEPESEVGDQSLAQSESIPRWPKIVQGWGMVEPSTPPMAVGFESTTPRAIAPMTPRATGIPKPMTPGTTTTPRTQMGLTAPKTPVLYTPRSTPSLRMPRSNPTLQPPRAGTVLAEVSRSGSNSPGLLSSPFASKIPRYTGSPRTRTVSFDPPSTRTITFQPEARMRTNSFEPSSRARTTSFDPKGSGRGRMWSAPGPEATKKPGVKTKVSFGDLSAMAIGRLKKSSMRDLQSKDSSSSMREFYSKGSLSTLSVASSESSGFPFTPLKAEVILNSPRVIVSHPSDPKVWNISRSSASSLWDTSSERTGENLVDPVHHPVALQPGAPLFDASASLVDSSSFYRPKAWGMSSPSLSHTQFEETRHSSTPVFARRRNTAASPRTESPPKQRKVKRVPVPPIPSELLEEHERQMTLKRNGTTGRMYELTVDASSEKVAPPPGLAFEDRNGDYRTGPGPKRLLENARAWFRRI